MVCGQTCMLWTSSASRRITDHLNDSRRPKASSLFNNERNGTRRRCRSTAQSSNAQSARNRRLFSPRFAAAIYPSETHLAAKISHLSARRYSRNACRISKSFCQDAGRMHSKEMHRIFRHRSSTCQITRGPTQRDIDLRTVSAAKVAPKHIK